MTYIRKNGWIQILLFFAFASPVLAVCGGSSPTWTAASASQSDVSDCVTAALDGDVINIPAGDETWSSQLTISGISLIGAGEDASGTNLTNGKASASGVTGMIVLAAHATNVTRVSNLSVNVASTGRDETFYIGTISDVDPDAMARFRVDHVTITTDVAPGFLFFIRNQYGLIDHYTFGESGSFDPGPGDTMIWIEHGNFLTTAETRWCEDTDLSTDKFVFIEDSAIYRADTGADGDIVDGKEGMRVVIRYNTIWNAGMAAHGCDSSSAGTRAYEIYENDFHHEAGFRQKTFSLRGGTGVIYNNSLETWIDKGTRGLVQAQEFRASHIEHSWRCRWDLTDSSGASNTTWCDDPAGEGYPCLDQIGRGRGSSTRCGVGAGVSNNQISDPLYVWDNTCQTQGAGVCHPVAVEVTAPAAYIQEDRDYILSAKPGYSAFVYPHSLQGAAASLSGVTLTGVSVQ